MAGHEVYKLTPGQVAQWRQAAEPLKAKLAAQVKAAGGGPDAIYNDLLAELKKHGALTE